MVSTLILIQCCFFYDLFFVCVRYCSARVPNLGAHVVYIDFAVVCLILSGKDQGRFTMAFVKGQSGNLAGRPKGTHDRRTELRELLEPHAGALIKKAVEMAMAGDTTAMKLCLERILPAVKSVEINPGADLIDLKSVIAEARMRSLTFRDGIGEEVDPFS
jgi:hypothetical protein